ncbi:zinc finger protein 8-like [Triticum urartu]|uniref:zinc finger protein 8-like n=1 Tax=Triticum urartu TaxID=4572 RepID=UPI002044308C|nr:zinc finger protein 8-like [Triticum urartu]
MATPQEVRRVDSFSQLPFIRPAAATAQQQQQQQQQARDTIRLFGREFSNNDALLQQQRKQEAGAGSPDATNGSTVTSEGNGGGGAKGGASGAAAGETRKFECHYCCRNFPTSQALGGHQNAHKRERQHAKRAHLQASLAMHRYVPGGHHMYGALLNYHHHHPAAARYDQPPPHYPMWTTASMGPYGGGGPGSMSQPIDGSPVAQGHWRVPLPAVENFGAAVRHGAAADMPPAVVVRPGEVMTCKDEKVVMSLLSSSPSLSSCSSTSPEKLGRCELGQQEALSLDLHL